MTTESKEAVQVKEPTMCKKREIIGHAIGDLGHDSMYTLWGSWMVPFMTEVLVLPAVFMGVILALVRVLDGVTDVAMGFIADTTKSRFGRYRAWLLRSGPIFGICMALSFFIPSDNMTVKMVFAGIMYLITGSFAFTSVDIPFWSLPAAMTSNTEERGKIVTLTTTVSVAIGGSIGIAMPMILVAFGGAGEPHAYLYPAIICAVFGIAMYLICFGLVREHVKPDPRQKFSAKLAIKNIFLNKPLLLLQISNIFVLFAMFLKQSFNYYYCQYNLGDLRYMTVLGILSLVATVFGGLMFQLVAKKLGKKNSMIALAVIYTVACLGLFFTGWSSVMVVYISTGISNLCIGAAMIAVNAMMMDTIEYGEWKTGQRNEGLITSTRCFVTKLAYAFAGIIVAAVVGLTGYVPLVEQSASTLNAFHFVYTLGCAVTMIIAIVPMFFYNLTEKKHAEIVVELAARKAAKDEGNQ